MVSKNTFNATLSLLGVVGFFSIVLPGIESVWNANPNDPEIIRRLQLGQRILIGIAGGLILLSIPAYGSVFPAFVGAIVLGSVVYAYRTALLS